MLKSSLCDYNGENILEERKIAVTGAGADAREADERNKQLILETIQWLLNNCISEVSNIHVNNAKDL